MAGFALMRYVRAHGASQALQYDNSAFDTLAVDEDGNVHGVWAPAEDPQVAATVERVLDSGKKVRLDTACVESLEWLSDTCVLPHPTQLSFLTHCTA